MKIIQILVLLALLIFANIINAQQVDEKKTKTKYALANKIIRQEIRNGEIYISPELQRYADLLSEDFGRKIDVNTLKILSLSEINGIDNYNVFRIVSNERLSNALNHFFGNSTYVEYNEQIYNMYKEFNKLMKDHGIFADSSNAFQIAEKFIRLNLCGNIQIDSIEFIRRKNLNFDKNCESYYNVEVFNFI